MTFTLDTVYSAQEQRFIELHNCEIISRIKLSKTDFSDTEIPKRMIKYGGEYIAEIFDDETNEPVWAVLSEWKGVWRFTSVYESLENMAEGL